MAEKITVSRKKIEALKRAKQGLPPEGDGFRYVNLPLQLFDDLEEGKINNKMFAVMTWLYRRADWSTGVAKKVSAPRIIAEMWPDELEYRQRPVERTLQREMKRLAKQGYITSQHVPGTKRPYSVIIHNFVASIDGKSILKNQKIGGENDADDDGDKNAASRRQSSNSKGEKARFVGEDDGDADGDESVTGRGRVGDSSASTLDSSDSSDSTDPSSEKQVSKEGSKQAPAARVGSTVPSGDLLGQDGTGSAPAPLQTTVMSESGSSSGVSVAGSTVSYSPADETWYRKLFCVHPQDTLSTAEVLALREVSYACLSRYSTDNLPVQELLAWVKANKKGKLVIRTAAQLRKAYFSDNPNGLRPQFEQHLLETYGDEVFVPPVVKDFCPIPGCHHNGPVGEEMEVHVYTEHEKIKCPHCENYIPSEDFEGHKNACHGREN